MTIVRERLGGGLHESSVFGCWEWSRHYGSEQHDVICIILTGDKGLVMLVRETETARCSWPTSSSSVVVQRQQNE
ncbi:unnamed protein product [Toxocara canis]|uniref:Uncharacterized protein n=1 Tax=Toxocara canis TaxID=6265 RepID=A0A183U928_TOXCA|nr:unnamed protein product [Toxocara canis]